MKSYRALLIADLIYILIFIAITTISIFLLNGGNGIFLSFLWGAYVLFLPPGYAIPHGIYSYVGLKKIWKPNLLFFVINVLGFSVSAAFYYGWGKCNSIADLVDILASGFLLGIISSILITGVSLFSSAVMRDSQRR